MNNICKLCKSNLADKTNSHLISKFLGKRLFEDVIPRHTILIGGKNSESKIQDTPKESFLFCSKCEKRFEIVETLCSHFLTQLFDYKNRKEMMSLNHIHQFQYLLCENIHPVVFKLFIYIQIWRATISNVLEFENLFLPNKIEENIRLFLNENLKASKEELMNGIGNASSIPTYDFCFIMPINTNKDSRGIYTCYNISNHSQHLFLVDFAILISYDDKIERGLKFYSNAQNNKVIVALVRNDGWLELSSLVYQKIADRKNGAN